LNSEASLIALAFFPSKKGDQKAGAERDLKNAEKLQREKKKKEGFF
jgi:hypothetical protein